MGGFTTRRLPGSDIRIVGRSPEDYAQELQEHLQKINSQIVGGIPGRFNATTPTPIEGGDTASAGSESAGWAAADHTHELNTAGVPGTVGTVSAQGGGPGVLLAGATMRLNIITTKGDLIGFDGVNPVRKAVGADGLALISDSSQSDGLRYGPTVLRPAQLVANTNDWAPGRFGLWLATTDASRDLTGVLATAAVDGSDITLVNTGAQPLVLKNQNIGSAIGNRLVCPGGVDLTLAAGAGARLIRDATAARWLTFSL